MKQQPWLISYEYRPVESISGHPVRGALTKTIDVIEMAPWKFLAVQKAKIIAGDKGGYADKEGLVRIGDEIVAIYWAAQLPIGALTDQELDLLS